MDQPALSVILPTYNESENLPILIERLDDALRGIAHEIIVVDDNSPDRTWEIAESLAERRGGMQVLRRLHDRGLSSAVVTGMGVARGQALAVMDADLQHDERILPRMLGAVLDDGFDLAVGSRKAEGGGYGEWSRLRRFISWTATKLAHWMLPIEVQDPMSGFFVVRRSVFLACADRINPLGFKILLEFIARNPGMRVTEIGFQFRNRIHGETKLSGSVIRNYLAALFDLKFGRVMSSTFFLYALVGASGVLVNIGGFAVGEWLQMPVLNIQAGLEQAFELHLSVGFGIQLSIFSNYVLNNYITFYENRRRGWNNLMGLLVFQAISMLGVVVQWSIFETLFAFDPLQPIWPSVYGKYAYNAIGILVAMVSNYYLNLNFTWRRRAG